METEKMDRNYPRFTEEEIETAREDLYPHQSGAYSALCGMLLEVIDDLRSDNEYTVKWAEKSLEQIKAKKEEFDDRFEDVESFAAYKRMKSRRKKQDESRTDD